MIMMIKIKKILKRISFLRKREISVEWIRKDNSSWLTQQFTEAIIKPPKNPFTKKIEQIAADTNKLGSQPLWDGYAKGDPTNDRGATREPNDVRLDRSIGKLFSYIICMKKPNLIVEFGTAFGVSGMYFLSGLEANKHGKLYTYEPNEVWAEIARKNLSLISNRFKLTIGTFEENIDQHLQKNQKIDVAFIDAIHTSEFVLPQLEIVIARSGSKSIIILDDINFSEDMQQCWQKVAADERFSASATLGKSVGIVELKN